MPNHRVITGFGGLDGTYAWISENVEEVLGLKAEQVLKHRQAVTPLLGNVTYTKILAEEKRKKHPRLTFRSWPVSIQNNGEAIPLSVIALFLRDGDGELENIAGAAWRCIDCPVCSRMSSDTASLRRAVLNLARDADSL